MGWTYIGKASGHNENAGTTLDCASTLDVQAGDLLVWW